MSFWSLLLGRPLASHEEGEQRVGPVTGIPMLGRDALSSAAYGPEAAMTFLIPLGLAGVQLDYILVVAVGISAGVGALVSAVPSLQPHTLLLCLAILALIAIVNLRGVRESGLAFVVPTYLFVGSLFVVIAIGVFRVWASGEHPVPIVAPPQVPAAATAAGLWLLLRAFASGCTAMTGVEAVSNGVTAFREPAVANARRTLTAIIAILVVLLAGIAYLCRAYHIAATTPGVEGYQSVLSMLVGAVVGRGAFYYLSIASILAVLALSANTGFADFPRLCRLLGEAGYLPRVFASRGRRLVYSYGIWVLTALSALLLLLFGGVTDRLIPLFAIGAFLAFTLSQAGMVVHWVRHRERGWLRSMTVNGVGAVATGITLLVVLVAKFAEGAWVTAILVPLLLVTFGAVRRHYSSVAEEIANDAPLDVTHIRPPIAIIPMREWNKMSQKGLRFALRLSPEIYVVQIKTGAQAESDLDRHWRDFVEAPARAAGLPVPQLVEVDSPFRHVFNPLIDHILEMKRKNPDRQIAVLIPELVARRWYHHLLHNKRAAMLKALLLVRGDDEIVVINVPWYLDV